MGWARSDTVGLLVHHVDLELSDSCSNRGRDVLPPKTGQPLWLRQELVATGQSHVSAGSTEDITFRDVRADRKGEVPTAGAAGTAEGLRLLEGMLRPLGANADRQAKALIDEFGSLGAVLAAGERAQARVLGRGAEAPRLLAAVRAAMLHVLREPALQPVVIADSRALIDYLSVDMAHLHCERLRILFLNARNRLLRDETVAEGSIDAVPVYPREIMRRALELGATAMILAHNHPSGDPAPSDEDIRATHRIAAAGETLGIRLHDHVIVAGGGWTSFRARGLLCA